MYVDNFIRLQEDYEGARKGPTAHPPHPRPYHERAILPVVLMVRGGGWVDGWGPVQALWGFTHVSKGIC